MRGMAGKTAVVTGGSSGIGRAIALALARSGVAVVIGSLRPSAKGGGYDERGDMDVVDLLRSEGAQAEFVQADVRVASDMEALADRTLSTYGSVDIWINNAGIVAAPKPFWVYDNAELEACLSVNTMGVWNGMRAAARRMLNQDGRGLIVNVLSTAGIRPHAMQSAYDISKAAAAQATRCAALELGPHGIRVNAVCPTVVKTAITRDFIETDQFQRWFRTIVPLGAAVEIDEVVQTVMFLASDAASAITGVLLPVDAGESLGPPSAEIANAASA